MVSDDIVKKMLIFRESLHEAMRDCVVENASADAMEPSVLSALEHEVVSNHRLAGACKLLGEDIICGFSLLDGRSLPSSLIQKIKFFVYVWHLDYGSSLELSPYIEIESGKKIRCLASIHINCNSEFYRPLSTGKFYAIFFADRFRCATKVNICASPFSTRWYRELHATPRSSDVFLEEPQLHFWQAVCASSFYNTELSPEERLSSGWLDSYRKSLEYALPTITQLFERRTELTAIEVPEEYYSGLEVLDLLKSNAASLQSLYSLFGSKMGIDSWWGNYRGFLTHTVRVGNQCRPDSIQHLFADVVSTVFTALFSQSPIATNCGRRICWVDGFYPNGIRTLDIKATHFSDDEIKEFWTCLPFQMPWGAFLEADDCPASLEAHRNEWEKVKLLATVEHSNALADFLIDEGLAQKEYVCPPGAAIPFEIGPIRLIKIYEAAGTVFFKLHDADDRFLLVTLNYFEKEWNLDDAFLVENSAHASVLRLILSSIVRDFWVVENRERIFNVSRVVDTAFNYRRSLQKNSVIYVPRVRYTNLIQTQKCNEELEVTARAPHRVSGHFRKVRDPSAHQLLLAKKYGFAIPAGYTFVRPHFRGHGDKERIYRSRSALKCLFQERVVEQTSSKAISWFQFEKDVAALMQRLGFTVEHKAVSRSGDQGVDILATKISPQTESWIIQCKCYSPHRKIGPDTVRELLGTIQLYPQRGSGMIITTSSFTRGAEALAEEHQIRLINGLEFAKLLAS